MTTLLVTSAIAPPQGMPFLTLTDPGRRLLATRAALYRWADCGLVERIVICDATGVAPLKRDDLELFAAAGVAVEQIVFEQDARLVATRGKGFGEGTVINHALDHSELLDIDERFFKITGKLFCVNFADIVITAKPTDCLFWNLHYQGAVRELIDTRFFHCSRDYWYDQLAEAYRLADDRYSEPVEKAVYPIISGNCKSAYTNRALLSGRVGGDGGMADESRLAADDMACEAWYR
ncbi:MAG: hypothetical protein ACRYGK_07875 [Janthinobacterium lividum]